MSVTFTLHLQKNGKTEPRVLTFHKSKDINVENLRQLLGIVPNEALSVIEGDDYAPETSSTAWRTIEREEDLGKSIFGLFFFFCLPSVLSLFEELCVVSFVLFIKSRD
jgi:hypothetical protein